MPITVKGTVKWSDNEERVQDAVVKAVSKTAEAPGARVKLATTNDDGDFELKDLEPGKWDLAILHQNGAPEEAREFEFLTNTEGVRFDVRRFLGVHDEKAGKWFFIALCIALGTLLVLYIGLHLVFPYRNAPVSEILLSLAGQAEIRAAASSSPKEDQELSALVAEIKRTWDAIDGSQVVLGPADRQVFAGRLAEIEKAIAEADQKTLVAGLIAVRRLVENPPSRGLFWTREPFRYLEVFFWGLAGILVALILTTGNYMRRRSFYREGIWQHIAQIVTIPLLALVVVLLLSQVTFSLTLTNNTELKVNLSDPRLLAAVAFLIGVQPWDTWRFVRETAGQITGTGRQSRQR